MWNNIKEERQKCIKKNNNKKLRATYGMEEDDKSTQNVIRPMLL